MIWRQIIAQTVASVRASKPGGLDTLSVRERNKRQTTNSIANLAN